MTSRWIRDAGVYRHRDGRTRGTVGEPVEETNYGLFYSTTTDRSNAKALNDAVVGGPIAIFTLPATDAASVAFSYSVNGEPFVAERAEATPPFDFKGAAGVLANLWDPPSGNVLIKQMVTRFNGTSQEYIAGFTRSGVIVTPPPEPPAPSGRPSAETTGYKGILTDSGTITTTSHGQVIENKRVTGGINVRHQNVTIRNCYVISGSTSFGISGQSNDINGNPLNGCLIENVEVNMTNVYGSNACIGGFNSASSVGMTKHGDRVTVRNCHLRGYGDGFKNADWSVIEGCYIHVRRAPSNEDKHVDGVQNSGHSHCTVRYNWIDQAYSGGHNAAIFFQPYNGNSNVYIEDIQIYGNWANGGVFTIQGGKWKAKPADAGGTPGPSPAGTNVKVYNNVLYRNYQQGVWIQRDNVLNNPPGVDHIGRWYDTGELVPAGGIPGGIY